MHASQLVRSKFRLESRRVFGINATCDIDELTLGVVGDTPAKLCKVQPQNARGDCNCLRIQRGLRGWINPDRVDRRTDRQRFAAPVTDHATQRRADLGAYRARLPLFAKKIAVSDIQITDARGSDRAHAQNACKHHCKTRTEADVHGSTSRVSSAAGTRIPRSTIATVSTCE